MTRYGKNDSVFLPESNERVLCFRVVEKMLAANYARSGDEMRQMIAEQGELRMVIDYENFDGWEEDAAKMDMGFSSEFAEYFTKMAFVNAPQIVMIQMKLKAPMMEKIQLRFFAPGEFDTAFQWANED